MVNYLTGFMHRHSFSVPRGVRGPIKPPCDSRESATPAPLWDEAVENSYKPSLCSAHSSS